MDYREQVMPRINHFPDAFSGYADMLDYVKRGRSPTKLGRKVTSNTRLYLLEDGSITVHVHKIMLAIVTPDNMLEFTASHEQVWHAGHSLVWNIHKTLPVWFKNIDKGRYKLVVREDIESVTDKSEPYYKVIRKVTPLAQEYFQHLKLDLKTGKIINRKDMTPVVNEDKRKQWLSGLKKTRMNLRAQARVGALDGRHNSYHFLDAARTKYIADCIMAGQLDTVAVEYLIDTTSPWRARSYSTYGDAVVATFENFVKSNSRELRVMAGVLDIDR